MSAWEIVAVLLAGMAAGGINAVVGSGTLVTFPTLLAFGLPPVMATVTNTIGLAPGTISGAWGYRRELAGQRGRLMRLGIASAIGACTGVVLLLGLPDDAFHTIVPILVGIGVTLVALQPLISKWLAKRKSEPDPKGNWLTFLFVYLAGSYGGYFAAAQGIIVTAVLTISLHETLQRANAAKNVLVSVVNCVAAILFCFVADVSWAHAGLIAVGSVIGGQIGASVGRRLPSWLLRTFIVCVGVVAIWQLLRVR